MVRRLFYCLVAAVIIVILMETNLWDFLPMYHSFDVQFPASSVEYKAASKVEQNQEPGTTTPSAPSVTDKNTTAASPVPSEPDKKGATASTVPNRSDRKRAATGEPQESTRSGAEVTQNETDATIRPAASPSAKRVNQRDYTELVGSINEYISQQEGEYGVYFISLSSGDRFGINEGDDYIAASTTKIPINLYLYKLAAEKKIDLSTEIPYTEDVYEEGTGEIQYEEFGKEYSLRELSRLSIEESDNVATNMIVSYLGWENVKEFMESIVKHPVDFEHNISNPKDMSIYMKVVLDFSKRNKKFGGELLNYFENTEFNDRIPVYLPEGIVIAHKIGNQVQALHDVGVVLADKPFILAVMSKEINEDAACDVIGNISKLVYDFEEN